MRLRVQWNNLSGETEHVSVAPVSRGDLNALVQLRHCVSEVTACEIHPTSQTFYLLQLKLSLVLLC